MIPREGDTRLTASFRDPSGFVFLRQGTLFRAVTHFYKDNYDRLMASGLGQALVRDGLLIPHVEERGWGAGAGEPSLGPGRANVYRIIRPEPVPFISYPYEWCFSQLKDAALTTLTIQRRALEFGMSLKDASAYNVQFLNGKPVLIDTLSFEQYREGEPWVAYRQFCQHFLAPLALMSHADIRLSQLLRIYVEGIPLDLASRLLPGRTRLALGLGAHIHLHARSQKHYADKAVKPTGRKLGRMAFMGLISSLESAVKGLNWKPAGTEWAEYYDETNYSQAALAEKQRLVGEYLSRVTPKTVWDLGANTGLFSRIAAGRGALTIASDIDPAAVERNYLDCRSSGEKNLLPLVLDLTNPSPGIGWQNQERMSFIERGPADTVLALALVHHLAIGNNLPFGHIADFLARIGRKLIIEFVPKNDSQVQRLLATREDIFPNYTQEGFEAALSARFQVLDQTRIGDSQRTLYLMTARC
jgi:ribosomal protein L11 methylase PrmA